MTRLIPFTAIGLCVCAGAGCMRAQVRERLVCASSSGEYCATVTSSFASLPLPGPETISVWDSAKFRIRAGDGKQVLAVALTDDNREDFLGDWQWSPDGRYLALPGRGLWVIDARDARPLRLFFGEILSYRWRDDDCLVYCTARGTVGAMSIAERIHHSLVKESGWWQHMDRFERWGDPLSPQGKLFARYDGERICIVDVNAGRTINSFPAAQEPIGYCWDAASERCLICAPDRSTLSLYERKVETITELTSRFRALDDRFPQTLLLSWHDAVLAPSGQWLIVAGPSQAVWICAADGSSVVRLQDEIGRDILEYRVSPKEDLLAFRWFDAKGSSFKGFCVVSISLEEKGRVKVSAPLRLSSSADAELVWAADGRALMTLARGRLKRLDVSHLLP